MTWVDLSSAFTYGSQLTSTQMQNLRDNITALANGDSGAPTILIAATELSSTATEIDYACENVVGGERVIAIETLSGEADYDLTLDPTKHYRIRGQLTTDDNSNNEFFIRFNHDSTASAYKSYGNYYDAIAAASGTYTFMSTYARLHYENTTYDDPYDISFTIEIFPQLSGDEVVAHIESTVFVNGGGGLRYPIWTNFMAVWDIGSALSTINFDTPSGTISGTLILTEIG